MPPKHLSISASQSTVLSVNLTLQILPVTPVEFSKYVKGEGKQAGKIEVHLYHVKMFNVNVMGDDRRPGLLHSSL